MLLSFDLTISVGSPFSIFSCTRSCSMLFPECSSWVVKRSPSKYTFSWIGKLFNFLNPWVWWLVLGLYSSLSTLHAKVNGIFDALIRNPRFLTFHCGLLFLPIQQLLHEMHEIFFWLYLLIMMCSSPLLMYGCLFLLFTSSNQWAFAFLSFWAC